MAKFHKIIVTFSLVLGFSLSRAWAESAPANQCVACHADYWQDMKGSVHFQQGITCERCHGGDPTKADKDQAKAPGTGYIGVPDKKQIVERCGACHADVEAMNFYGLRTDQLARYKTSQHGKKLFLEGDSHVAVCSDCHGTHDVLPVSDPSSPAYPLNVPKTCNKCHGNERLMSSYHLPADMFKAYESSVHGKALFQKKNLSVATCVSCHGNHGAVPPGVKDVATTCGKCHANEKKYFLESVHAAAQEQGKFSECISCHGNHGVNPPTPDLYAEACVKCHKTGSPEFRQGQRIADSLRKSQDAFAEAEAMVKQASIEGLYVEDDTAALEAARTDFIAMAPLQHTLSLKRILELHDKVAARTQEIKNNVQQKRENLERRKKALILVWVFILLMVLALWTQYKRLMKQRHGDGN